jgi:L-lactate dehydrogenase complex protein LldG
MTARESILANVAAAKVTPKNCDRPTVGLSQSPRADIVHQFAEYVAEYKADVIQVPSEAVAQTIAVLLKDETALIPSDLPPEWIPAKSVTDEALSIRDLDKPEAVITLCAVGIAETGTIVLDAGLGQGRRAITLVPDHHILVVPEDRIVDSVPEAVAALAEAIQAGRPLTWISGPSATSDIELSRVEGVHGPRRLDVIIVKAG